MRASALLAMVLLACTDMGPEDMTTTPGLPDAPRSGDAAPGIEDLDMTLGDFAHITGLMTPTGRGYSVTNLLGHEAEALAAGASATGGNFPVGTVMEAQPTEIMVKRRHGFDSVTNDWEFFSVSFSAGVPTAITLRGTESTDCFACHSTISSVTWDFVCDHP